MVLELIVVAAVWLRYREKAKPFLVAAGFIVAQMIGMALLNNLSVVKALLTAIGQTPSAVVWLTGFGIGALTSWRGWQAGKSPSVPIIAQPEPA
jgi:hypothetical protein